jgi:hypothetical protein
VGPRSGKWLVPRCDHQGVTAVERARADLLRGEPWLARDRLIGALRDRPVDQEVLRGLAEAYTALNDLPAAGGYWLLTDTDGEAPAEAGLAALRARYRTPVGVAQALRVRGRVTDYPAPARTRILDLQAELNDLGWTWTPPSRPRPAAPPRRQTLRQDVAEASLGVFGVTVAAVLAVANLGIYVVGMVAILRAIW